MFFCLSLRGRAFTMRDRLCFLVSCLDRRRTDRWSVLDALLDQLLQRHSLGCACKAPLFTVSPAARQAWADARHSGDTLFALGRRSIDSSHLSAP
jgi:hypothetical protein